MNYAIRLHSKNDLPIATFTVHGLCLGFETFANSDGDFYLVLLEDSCPIRTAYTASGTSYILKSNDSGQYLGLGDTRTSNRGEAKVCSLREVLARVNRGAEDWRIIPL